MQTILWIPCRNWRSCLQVKQCGNLLMDAKNKSNNKDIDLIRNVVGILIPIVIYYITRVLAYIALTALVIEIVHLDRYILEREATIRVILGGISMLIGILPLLSSLKREIDGRQNQVIHARNIKDIPLYKSVLITITLAIMSSVVINILFIWLRLAESSETYTHVAEHQYGVSLATGLILYGIISPLAEEALFRGIIYNRIRKNCSIFAAVLLSSLLFGLYHGNIVQGAYGFLMGILIAYTYERFGSFFHAFLFHATANVAVYIITSNETIADLIITPHICLIFTLISAVLICRMSTGKL